MVALNREVFRPLEVLHGEKLNGLTSALWGLAYEWVGAGRPQPLDIALQGTEG